MATCDIRGGNVGPASEGTARILDDSGTEAVRAALRRKYGLTGRITLWGSRIRRGRRGTIGIRIDLA